MIPRWKCRPNLFLNGNNCHLSFISIILSHLIHVCSQSSRFTGMCQPHNCLEHRLSTISDSIGSIDCNTLCKHHILCQWYLISAFFAIQSFPVSLPQATSLDQTMLRCYRQLQSSD